MKIEIKLLYLNKDEGGSASTAAGELGLANVGGVFVVLVGGLGLAALTCICEFFYETRKQMREENLEGSIWRELFRELRKSIVYSSNTKAVKRRRSSTVPQN